MHRLPSGDKRTGSHRTSEAVRTRLRLVARNAKLQGRRKLAVRGCLSRLIIHMEFEYLICQTQYSRVTFVNGSWQGRIAVESGDSQAALDSCPQIWEYLARVGSQ